MLSPPKERTMKYVNSILIGLPIWFVVGILITFSPEVARDIIGLKEPVGRRRGRNALPLPAGGIRRPYLRVSQPVSQEPQKSHLLFPPPVAGLRAGVSSTAHS